MTYAAGGLIDTIAYLHWTITPLACYIQLFSLLPSYIVTHKNTEHWIVDGSCYVHGFRVVWAAGTRFCTSCW